VLECVVNVSEGRDARLLDRLAQAAGEDLLDVHTDPFHHRSVFTLVGTVAPRRLTERAVELLDLTGHHGVHPRLGVVDVVPFVPLAGSSLADALVARNEFADWAAHALGVPCFRYGPERSLPDIRRRAWQVLAPDTGPDHPHPTAGAICVGARPELVAYNVFLASPDLDAARAVARDVRGPHLRALGLAVGAHVQVSMNLIEPDVVGPAEAYDLVAALAEPARAELVGLLTERVLERIPVERRTELDVGVERTVEWRLSQSLDARRRAWLHSRGQAEAE